MAPKQAVMILIRDNRDRYLFVRRHPSRPAGGYWTPPSGRIEPGETQQETVKREALEELGIIVEPVRHLGSMPCSTGEYLLHWWFVVLRSGSPYIAAPEEIDNFAWASLAELKGLTPHFPEDVEFICRQHEKSG